MPDQGQDFLSLGLDISAFDEAKKAKLQEFIALFDQLTKYDGKVINPIFGAGLTELNASISQTSTLLQDLNTKLSQLSSSGSSAGNALRNAASGSKVLTEEQAKQKVQIQELNRLTLAQAQAQNSLSQSRINAKKAIQEQFAAETQLANQQKADSALIAALIKKQAKEEEDFAKQQQRDSALLAAMHKKDAAQQAALIKQQAKAEEQLSIQQERDSKTILKLKAQQEAASQRSIKQSQKEQAANKLLTNDYYQLTQSLKDQATAYSNLYLNKGKNDPATKAALAQYGDTANVINKVDKQLQSAEPHAFGLGKGLSTIYNRLRIIAYILPGIGVAGIFSLAFEGLKSIADGLSGITISLEDILKDEDRHNKLLTEQLSILRDLKKAEEDYIRAINNYSGIKPGSTGSLSPENKLLQDQAKGLDNLTISAEKAKVAQDKLGLSTFTLDKRRLDIPVTSGTNMFGVPEYTTRTRPETDAEMTSRLEKERSALANDIQVNGLLLKNLQDQSDKLSSKIANEPGFSFKDNYPGQSKLKKYTDEQRLKTISQEIDDAKSSLDLSKEKYQGLSEDLDNFYNNKKDKSNEDLQNEKDNADALRKYELSVHQDRLDMIKDVSQRTLALDTSTERQRIKAINDTKNAEIEFNKFKLSQILDDPSKNKYEKQEAINSFGKEGTQNILAQNKANDDIIKLIESNRRVRLELTTSMDKDLLDESSTTNKKIYNDDKKSLEDRLTAYKNYIVDSQSLADLDYSLKIDKLSKIRDKDGKLDPTAALGIQAAASERDKQKLSVQADIEKESYNIVYSSFQKQLKLTIEQNDFVDKSDQDKYTKQLNALNKSYDDKKLSYEKYAKALRALEKKYNITSSSHIVQEDQVDIIRLKSDLYNQQLIKNQADKDVDVAQVGLDTANAFGGNKIQALKDLNSAKGRQAGAVQSIKDLNQAIKSAQDKLSDDSNKNAKAGISQKEKDKNKELLEYASQVERKLYESIKSFTDAGYEYRLSILEKTKAIIDEQYDYEQKAIEKSSLSQKDKAALDIQLSEQKKEYDKKAQADERNLKREKAEFDKKLSIAHIIIGTAAAVAEALPDIPKSVAVGVIGAIELATAIATPIPSFKEGVIDFKGGKARYGEAGMEVIKEPGKQARLVMTETVSYLPKGTDIIPVKESPVFEERLASDGWDQTLFLAKEIKKLKQQPKNITNVIKIDLGFERYKKRVLGNG